MLVFASYIKLFRIKKMFEDDNSFLFHPLRSLSSSLTPVKKPERGGEKKGGRGKGEGKF